MLLQPQRTNLFEFNRFEKSSGLICVTAGTALGFNRARLFLVDKERDIVYGKMAVWPLKFGRSKQDME